MSSNQNTQSLHHFEIYPIIGPSILLFIDAKCNYFNTVQLYQVCLS